MKRCFYLKGAASAILSKKNGHTFNPVNLPLDKDGLRKVAAALYERNLVSKEPGDEETRGIFQRISVLPLEFQ